MSFLFLVGGMKGAVPLEEIALFLLPAALFFPAFPAHLPGDVRFGLDTGADGVHALAEVVRNPMIGDAVPSAGSKPL